VEHISWDERGRPVQDDNTVAQSDGLIVLESSEEQAPSDGVESDDESSSSFLEEESNVELPLFHRNESSSHTDDNLRHRLPAMGDLDEEDDDIMDEDEVDDQHHPLLANASRRSTTMRSRRNTPSTRTHAS
jgi:hypothetical protein